MEQWEAIVSKYGILGLILGFLGWVSVKYIGPWVKGFIEGAWGWIIKQVEDAQAQRKAEVEKFVNTMDGYRKVLGEMSDTQRGMAKTLDAIAKGIRGK